MGQPAKQFYLKTTAMRYTEAELDAMQYDPIAARGYYWRCAMGARRRALVSRREIIERGQTSNTQRFEEVYERDGRDRDWADVELRFAQSVLENLDIMVRYSLERPKVCAACRGYEQKVRES